MTPKFSAAVEPKFKAVVDAQVSGSSFSALDTEVSGSSGAKASSSVEAKVSWRQRTSRFLAAVDSRWQQWTPKFVGSVCQKFAAERQFQPL